MAIDRGPHDETFGQRIQRLRRELGRTQREVAGDLGLDFTYLSKLENSRGEPPSERTVRNLAGILKTDEEELLALAGRLPAELQARAHQDPEFAMFLRRLPDASKEDLREMYRRLRPPSPDR